MSFTLVNFYVQTGATRSDVLPSVISFEAHNGLCPDPGSLSAKFQYPVLDTSGNTVTLAKGMTIWMKYTQTFPTSNNCTPFAGVITDLKQTGDVQEVTAESLLAPIMRATYTHDYSSSITAMDIIQEIVAAFTPVEPYLIIAPDSIYRATTGGASVGPISDITVDDCEFDQTPVGSILQYFCELPAFSTLTNILCSVTPGYYTDSGTGKASVALTYLGYGMHRLTAIELDYDAGLLSMVDWSDSTDSVLNDVTVTIKGDTSYQATDATSISAYGQRETKLFRPMYYTDTTYARKHADTMIAALKDPKSRCTVDVDQDYILTAYGSLNLVYTITDDITGKSEEMVLRSYTIKYPGGVCSCEFDNAALNLSNYGIRLENRVSNLESNLVTAHSGFYDLQGGQSGQYYHLNSAAYNNLYQQDQAVKTTSSPTFTAVNIGSDTQLYRSAANVLSLASGDSLAVNGTAVIDSSRNLTNIGTVMCGAISSSGFLYMESPTYTSDVGALKNTSATAGNQVNLSIDRTNQTGTQLQFGIWDRKNSKWATINGNGVLIANTSIVDSSRNLANIGTVKCGAITSTGILTVGGSAIANATGYVNQPKNLMCSAYASGDTICTASTYTKIALAAEEFDGNGVFSSSRFTAPVAGKYLVCAQLCAELVGTGILFRGLVVKNCSGGNYPTTGNGVLLFGGLGHNSEPLYLGSSKIVVLAANDYLEMWAHNGDTSNRAVGSGDSLTYMSVHYLGA